MTIYSQIFFSGTEIAECYDYQVNRSYSDNNEASSFSAEVDNYKGQNAGSFVVGNEITIYADQDVNPPTTLIFRGILEDVNFTGENISDKIRLSGRDYTARLMDKTVQPEVYTNLEAGSIVKDIVAKYVDGIDTSGVQTTLTTIDRIAASVKLFPERFMTTERILEAQSMPDIDLNLGNPEVFAQAQIDILGENHSYPMIAYGTMRPKAAWKLYARAKNIDFITANSISEQIENYEMELKHTPEDEKDSVNVLDFINPDYQEIFLQSKRYLGIVSDAKIHPCGYVLYNGNIKEEIGIIKVKENIC